MVPQKAASIEFAPFPSHYILYICSLHATNLPEEHLFLSSLEHFVTLGNICLDLLSAATFSIISRCQIEKYRRKKPIDRELVFAMRVIIAGDPNESKRCAPLIKGTIFLRPSIVGQGFSAKSSQ